MYAKLVVGNTTIHPILAMRDIGLLITSTAPSVSLLSGFNTTSSVIIDDTPAGWSYVGSVAASDRPSIAATGSATGYTNDTHWNLAFSAPTAENPNILKYAALNLVWRSTASTNYLFALTGAAGFTNQGVATNEGPRFFSPSTAGVASLSSLHSRCQAGDVIHLIATERHITIINENEGMSAVWESSNTDAHRFFNAAPFVQYNHCNSAVFTRQNTTTPGVSSVVLSTAIMASVFNITDVNTGTFYGTYDFTQNLTTNTTYLVQTNSTYRLNSINASGLPKYQISPVFYQVGNLGYPTQFVTGAVPIYWTRENIGTTGDSVEVSGDTYTFFNCGSGFGVIMKTN